MATTKQYMKRGKASRGKKTSKVKQVKVKKERSRTTSGKLRKKPRVTAKRRNASREAMAREVALSEELGDLLGASSLSRPEAVSRLWAHCRDNGMLNPKNKREIRFDTKLKKMFGRPTATMPQLIGLLTPHLDYTRTTVKQEAIASGKRTPLASANANSKRVKHEPTANKGAMEQTAIEETLATTVLRISAFDRTSVVVVCAVPEGCCSLEAVATPRTAGNLELRAPCVVEHHRFQNAASEPQAEGRLVGLDPKLEYHIKVQICGGRVGSPKVILPQRAWPGMWSPRDVKTWCQVQHVPELVRMAQEYAIDGSTLLSMGEEDFKASGLRAPFLLRRVLDGLAALRAGGS